VSKHQPRKRLTKLDTYYQRYLRNERSADFITNVWREYSIATLERLALAGRRVSRRAAALALGFLGDYDSSPVLVQALRDRDRAVRLLAEHGLRQLWFRAGNADQYQILLRLVRLNDNGQYQEAVDLASLLIDESPLLAEGWNQRAIGWFGLDDFEESAADCRQVLELNPHHFNSAMGLGHCYLQLDQPALALDAFRLALQLNPSLECVRSQIRQLERAVNREQLDD
jgi:tetratricopeptide (TPR) repeat protein